MPQARRPNACARKTHRRLARRLSPLRRVGLLQPPTQGRPLRAGSQRPQRCQRHLRARTHAPTHAQPHRRLLLGRAVRHTPPFPRHDSHSHLPPPPPPTRRDRLPRSLQAMKPAHTVPAAERARRRPAPARPLYAALPPSSPPACQHATPSHPTPVVPPYAGRDTPTREHFVAGTQVGFSQNHDDRATGRWGEGMPTHLPNPTTWGGGPPPPCMGTGAGED
jgi:hypothetical protein